MIAIRVDASLKVGTGHVYRMMTLGSELVRRNHEVIFFCRELQGNLICEIKKKFSVITLDAPEKILKRHDNYLDWLEVEYEQEIKEVKAKLEALHSRVDCLIADSYAIDYQWHSAIKNYVTCIIQIDDLDNRKYDCDVIIDQNLYICKNRYKKNSHSKTKIFCGPEYAMLRPAFTDKRRSLSSYQSRMRDGEVVIFFGGVDVNNETGRLIEKILQEKLHGKFNIIIGKHNPHKAELLSRFDRNDNNLIFHVAIDNVEEVFARSYLFIGAVGSTTWERCVLALPGIVVAVAENQVESAETLCDLGCHFYLGFSTAGGSINYIETFSELNKKKYLLELQSRKCGQLTDGSGARRVAEIIEGNFCE